MNCDEARILLHALIDGELDAGHASAIEAHAADCPRCGPELAAYRELRQAVSSQELGYRAPAFLRQSIGRALPAPAPAPSRRTLLKGFAMGGFVTAAMAAGVAFLIVGQSRDDLILSEAVSAHLRSLQAEHLTDVMSSDRHTVKPWFNGRIDLAPPVIDLTAQGFTLIGGRLDYISGKPVAALVYRRRVHVINLFVGQDLGAGGGLSGPELETFQGFNILRWSGGGLDLLAVSDLNPDELKDFAAKFEAAARAARPG
jgi:anti-sigma factor RsiW